MEELRKQIRRLDFESKWRAGRIRITPEMRIADILAIHPRMKEVLAGVHLGGCSSCAASESESLAAGAASYGLDVGSIMSEINKFLADPDHYTKPENPHPPTGTGDSIGIRLPAHRAEI